MPGHVELSIDLRPTERVIKAYVTDSRALKWRDVEILALAESVQLTRGDSAVQLTFAFPAANAGLPDDLFIGAGI